MLPRLLPFIEQVMGQVSVVRASRGDLRVVFGTTSADSLYRSVVGPRCPRMVCTRAADPVSVYTPQGTYSYPVQPITTVSTIGAGDNFNAGFIYGLVRLGITRRQLERGLSQEQWANWWTMPNSSRKIAACTWATISRRSWQDGWIGRGVSPLT
jgi:fructokinase